MTIFKDRSRQWVLKALPFIVSLISTIILFSLLFNYPIENGYVDVEVVAVWI